MELLMTTTSTTPDQLGLMGRHIDRLVTVEARISPTSRNAAFPLRPVRRGTSPVRRGRRMTLVEWS
jgi:hypothetical protein